MRVSSKDYNLLGNEANKIVSYLRKNLSSESVVLGPTTASPFKINNVFRFQIIIKYKFDNNISPSLAFIDETYALNKAIFVDIDVNPIRI